MSPSRTPQAKKANARRRQSPASRSVNIDRGTAESRMRRRELIGGHKDETLATDAIGILMARGHLGGHGRQAEQRLYAGRRFADLRRFIFGAMLPQQTMIYRAASMPGGIARPAPSDDEQHSRDLAMKQSYENALAALRRVSSAALQQTVYVCHWSYAPDWSGRVLASIPTLADLRAQADLLSGLDALVETFGFAKSRSYSDS